MPYPPVDEITAARHAEDADAPAYSAEERAFLLSVARQAIAAALEQREYLPEPLNDHLAEPRGVFTTLHIGGQLRGCVGQVIANASLTQAVAETAVSAAFSDPRFAPLTIDELPQVNIEISVLSPLRPIRARDVECGRHGLLVSLGGYRGLLLPQVATEYNWEAETFLEQTCRKAGLPPNAWQHPQAQIFGFTAELFGEEAAASNKQQAAS